MVDSPGWGMLLEKQQRVFEWPGPALEQLLAWHWGSAVSARPCSLLDQLNLLLLLVAAFAVVGACWLTAAVLSSFLPPAS